MHVRPLLLLSAMFALAVSVPAQRLSTDVHPEHYKLHFTPDLKSATFTGEETIDVVLHKPSNAITLNALELKIAHVKTGSMTGSVSYDAKKEQATLTFPKTLPAGKAQIQLAFTGILNDKLRGFYLSKTAKRNYAVTQFESTDARRAFPSFDEPAMKATFDVSLTIDKGDNVIANGPLVSDVPVGEGKHTQTFATTPKMSTYLVAFQVGDFECSKGEADGVPIRACATPDQVKQTKFALKAAEHFLHFYNNYFGIRYPMQKLDMVGIPDFEAGAMENFGCITYRETDLLVDEKASLTARKRVAVVVAHEMAHQWFGDMVTMKWWDNVWLNEGFANWMESKAVGEWKPEWQMRDDEAQTLNETLDLDSQPTTHAIRAKADTPAEIEEMFDGISYGKGGSVLGMVEHYVGEETFRRGVHNYLAAHLYANATAEDFWNAQTKTSGKPVDRIMSGFVEQIGTPLLRFSEVKNGMSTVAQSRFLLSNEAKVSTAESWTVPVCVRGEGCTLVTAKDDRVKASAPLYANADFKGYYRTQYANADLKNLLAHVSSLSSPERIGLVGDRWALVRAGEGSLADYMDLLTALRADDNATVLDTALDNLKYVRTRMADEKEREQLNAWVRDTYGPVYKQIRSPHKKDDDNLKRRRALLLEVLGSADDPVAVSDAKEIADRYFKHDMSIDRELAGKAINVAAAHGDTAFYERIKEWEKSAQDTRTRVAAQKTLSEFNDPALVQKTLDYAYSGAVRNQDNYWLLLSLMERPETRPATWKYVQEHWDAVSKLFTVTSGQRTVRSAQNFCSEQDRDEVQQFFAAHPVPATERTLRITLNAIHACSEMKQKQQGGLDQWLMEHTK
ncbi:MAG: M1 family metallopeptidase [Acidobacteria bacterium]|nr:M1 family metallopeptidase [Acidobacteriota bacterium]